MIRYYLHFIGTKLYPKEVFIKEAEKFGVNRCLPLPIIKGLKWGDKILLATFYPQILISQNFCPTCNTELFATLIDEKEGTYKYTCDKCQKEIQLEELISVTPDGRKNKSNGRAEIFGYFIVSGLNIKASDEFKKELTSQLDIVSTKENNLQVQRQCGSYNLGNSYVVKDSIENIIKKAIELSKLKNEEVKFFVAGQFKPLNLEIEPINFARTVVPVELDTSVQLEDLQFLQEVGLIYDYDKRTYIKTHEKRGRPRKEK
jgi:DNA-directed RNA polymerase subunit M/transcription elongation factor TFIIS